MKPPRAHHRWMRLARIGCVVLIVLLLSDPLVVVAGSGGACAAGCACGSGQDDTPPPLNANAHACCCPAETAACALSNDVRPIIPMALVQAGDTAPGTAVIPLAMDRLHPSAQCPLAGCTAEIDIGRPPPTPLYLSTRHLIC